MADDYTKRIYYELTEDKKGYILNNIDKCLDDYIVLRSVFDDGKTLTEIGANAFKARNSKIKSVRIPNTVTKIGEAAFNYCISLKSITIPGSVREIGSGAFNLCKAMTEFIVDPSNKNFKAIDGNLYSYDGTVLIQYALGKTETSFTIPDGVKVIEKSAFCDSQLEEIVMPESVTTIKDHAFSSCEKLKKINISKNIVEIGDSAFRDSEYIAAKVILPHIIAIGKYAFYGCEYIDEVLLGNNLISIGEYAFGFCCIKTVQIPLSVKTMEFSVFGSCKALETVCVERKKPLLGTPAGWSPHWLCNNKDKSEICNAKVIWNYKGMEL